MALIGSAFRGARRGVGATMRTSRQGWGHMGRAAAGTPRAGGRLGWAGARAVSGGALNHPGLMLGGAVLAGAAAAQVGSALSPGVQETFLGAPNAVGTFAREQATANLLQSYDPRDRNNPYDAMMRGGNVLASPQYLYGRPVAGGYLGNIAGSRTLGGYTLQGNPRTERIRGSGRDQPANGAMVFGMWNLRR